jgi:hypothetical protein
VTLSSLDGTRRSLRSVRAPYTGAFTRTKSFRFSRYVNGMARGGDIPCTCSVCARLSTAGSGPCWRWGYCWAAATTGEATRPRRQALRASLAAEQTPRVARQAAVAPAPKPVPVLGVRPVPPLQGALAKGVIRAWPVPQANLVALAARPRGRSSLP